MNQAREPQWYALYLRSRYERKVDQRLRESGVESFLPLIEEVHLWSDRRRKVLEPLFRSYLFVKTDLRDRSVILETDGVVRFVGVRHTPSPIPDSQIQGLRIAASHPAQVRREGYYPQGQAVRVISGIFEGIEGFVVRLHGHSRVVLAVDSIAQSVSFVVPEEYLRKM